MKRNGLTLRKKTTTCQKPPADFAPKLVDFVMFIRKQRKINQYPYGFVYACDETAVWLDPTGSQTVAQVGDKGVPVRTTGHEKMRLTVMLCARENGTKCQPMVLMNRKRPIPEIVKQFSGKLTLIWVGKSWFDDELTSEFLTKVIGTFSFGKRLLVWDAFRCHISVSTKEELARMNIDIAVVPGGCTKFIQAPDVYWNKPFKDHMRKSHEDWLMGGEKSYTKGGNMRPPEPKNYLQWILDAWENISVDLIQKSFKGCGISVAVDGSEDEEIHCFKKDASCPEGYELLKSRMDQAIQEEEEAQEVEIEPQFFCGPLCR